jgi:hypothetical protein
VRAGEGTLQVLTMGVLRLPDVAERAPSLEAGNKSTDASTYDVYQTGGALLTAQMCQESSVVTICLHGQPNLTQSCILMQSNDRRSVLYR